MKKLSIIFSLVAALIIAAAAFFIATFDANHYKQQIITLINKQTGRELTIDGDLKLALFPDIAIQMGHTSLSNAAGFSDDHFATIDSAQVSVALLPLLKKTIKVDEIRLNGLKLNLHRKANGTTNWEDLAGQPASEEKKTDTDKPTSKTVAEMLNNLSIAGINLNDADIHWQDAQGGQDLRLSPVNLKTGTFRPGKPLPVEWALVLQQKNPATTLAIEGQTTLTADKDKRFTLSELTLHTNITGTQFPNGSLEADLSGSVAGSPETITIPDLQFKTKITGDLIPEGEIQTELTGKLNLDMKTQQVQLTAMQLNTDVTGKPLQGGALRAILKGDSRFQLSSQQFNLPRLTLDVNLAGGPLKNGTANTRINGDLSVNLAQSQLSMPQLTLNTQLEGGLVPGGNLSQQAQGKVSINWKNKQGSIDLRHLQVKLADLELTGQQVSIQPLAEKPAISGQFQSNTFNLKQVLKTLGITPPVTRHPQALSQVQLQFKLDANTEQASLQPLTLKLDKTTLTGKLAVSNFTQPALRPELSIDQINIDDYLAPDAPATSTATPQATGSQALLPLDLMRGLDIDGGFSIKRMVINKLSLSQVKTRIKAHQGLITIDPANANLYQGRYTGSITLDARQNTPLLTMQHELKGLRSEGLLYDLFQDKYISGDAQLVTRLSSRGNTLDALLKNLNGTTRIAFKDGTIRDSRLAEKTALAIKAFEKKEIKGDKSVITFTGLSGDFKTTNGVFDTRNLKLVSPYLNISASGSADLTKQQLDMKLRIGPKQSATDKSLFAPLHIYGSFADPKFKLDLQDLVKALAQQDLDKARQKAEAKLKQAEQEARQKLQQEKKALQDRLTAEKAAREQQLRQQLDAAKTRAVQQVEQNLGNKLGDRLKQQLGTGDSSKPAPDTGTEKAEETSPPASVEDQVKDKLKGKLRDLF